MGVARLQRIRIVKGRIALYAGYFVAMLLLAAYLTGVLQQGIFPHPLQREAVLQDDEQSTISDEQDGSQETDRSSETTPVPPEQAAGRSLEEKSTQMQVPSPESSLHSSEIRVPDRKSAARNLKSSSDKSVVNEVRESAAADRQEKQLAEKRAELSRLEEQIRKQREESEIEKRWLAEMKAARGALTKEQDARREAGIKKLAKLYEGMEPEAAALILSKLKNEMATEVLASMKDRQASRVLAAMNGQRAKELSERLEEGKLDRTIDHGKAGEVIR